MGKNFNRWIGIVFFPVTIIFFICKKIYNGIENLVIGKYLRTLPIKDIDGLDGHTFEDLLFYTFKVKGLKVRRTKKSRDYGADLIIQYKKLMIVLQCKLYYNHSVGNSAIQEIATAKTYYQADIGIVITNSTFTKPAETLAEKAEIRLINRENLEKIFSSNKTQLLSLLID